jgi:RHS repeat-associated protein
MRREQYFGGKEAMRTSKVISATFGVLLIFGAVSARGQGARQFIEQEANLGKGFDATKAYEGGQIDNINTFNGNLNVSIPLGLQYPINGGFSFSLGLVYNSSIWESKGYPHDQLNPKDPKAFTDTCATFTQEWPSWLHNGGLGWEVSLGRLFGPGRDLKTVVGDAAIDGVELNAERAWTFYGSDGGRHEFFGNLHSGSDTTTSNPLRLFTRDSSYLRLVCLEPAGASSWAQCVKPAVEVPSGGRLEFEPDPNVGPEEEGFRLKRARDSFGNGYTVTYHDTAPRRWEITDDHGRKYWVYFTAPKSFHGKPAFGRDMVDKIELPGAMGTKLTYTFSYTAVQIDRPKTDSYPWGETIWRSTVDDPTTELDESGRRIVVQRLDRVVATSGGPELLSYSFAYAPIAGAQAGRLVSATLPTGGKIQWEYSLYAFPSAAECPRPDDENKGDFETCSWQRAPFHSTQGVVSRTEIDHNGTELGKWTYGPSIFSMAEDRTLPSGEVVNFPTCGDHREIQTLVTDPLGHQTRHYYSIYVQGEDVHGEGWTRVEYGLPFTRRLALRSGGLFLSNERSECNGPTCKVVAATYVNYERSPTEVGPEGALSSPCNVAGSTPEPFCTAHQSRLKEQKVVYPAGGPSEPSHFVHTVNRHFDGLGHFRESEVFSDLPGEEHSRTTFTNYNPGAGTLVVDLAAQTATGFTAPSRWLLGTFTDSWVRSKKNATVSGTKAVQHHTFDAATGFLEQQRFYQQLSDNPSQSSGDVVTEFIEQGSTGNVASVRRQLGANTPEYQIDRTFDRGVVQSVSWLDLADSANPKHSLLIANRTLDSNTGLVRFSTDAAGVTTEYRYDALGRLTFERMGTTDLSTVYQYHLGKRPAELRMGRGEIPSAQMETHYRFDGLGRLIETCSRLPGGDAWGAEKIGYLGDGSVAWVTDRHPVGPTIDNGCPNAAKALPPRGYTRNESYDAFGRPREVIAPDGRRTDISYHGVRSKVVTVNEVARELGSATGTAKRSEEYDSAGRIVAVHEFSIENAQVKTAYAYDVLGQLREVVIAPGGVKQTRTFEHDGRGFLVSEVHPEISGSVSYDEHDSLGNPLHRSDGERAVRMTYDFAGRLLRVRLDCPNCPAGVGFVLEDHEYGRGCRTAAGPASCTAAGASREAGKLVRSRYHNWFERPLDSGQQSLAVTETFWYGDPIGRLTVKSTTAYRTSLAPADTETRAARFEQRYAYDSVGNLTRMTYPFCSGASHCAAAAQEREVTSSYDRGYLTSVHDGATGAAFASFIGYDANGMVTAVHHGSGTGAAPGVTGVDSATVDPSGLPRPATMSLAGWNLGAYGYDGMGNVFKIGNDFYRYDPVGRLREGTVLGGTKKQEIAYDLLGNVTSIGSTDRLAMTLGVSTATNRLNEATYDISGNVTALRGMAYRWDLASRLTNIKGTGSNRAYAYTAAGERLVQYDFATGRETWTLRGPGNEVLRRLERPIGATGAVSVEDNVYRGGRLLASVRNGEVVEERHYHPDHLGSTRRISNASGGEISRHTYYPFGEEATGGRVGGTRHRFTGHERDLNSEAISDKALDDLDYMHARYYTPVFARFLSVDPVLGKASSPQSWNRYSYVRNTPLLLVDPDGRDVHSAMDAGGVTWEDLGVDSPTPQQNALVASLHPVLGPIQDAWTLVSGKDFAGDDQSRVVAALGLLSGPARVGRLASRVRPAVLNGIAVIGHNSDNYVGVGKRMGANYFDVPTAQWKAMTPAQQWAANRKFLDRQIARGADFYLATDPDKMRRGSALAREVGYLLRKGYVLNKDPALGMWRLKYTKSVKTP